MLAEESGILRLYWCFLLGGDVGRLALLSAREKLQLSAISVLTQVKLW